MAEGSTELKVTIEKMLVRWVGGKKNERPGLWVLNGADCKPNVVFPEPPELR